MFIIFVFSFLVIECNLVLFGVGTCAKFLVLSQLIVFLVLFYPCFISILFQLVYFVITNIEVLLVVF